MKLAVAAFAFGCLAGMGAAFAAPPTPAESAEAKALIASSCVLCHEEVTITSARHSEAGWDETLKRMVGNGAAISDRDMAKLKAYLVATYAETPPAPAK